MKSTQPTQPRVRTRPERAKRRTARTLAEDLAQWRESRRAAAATRRSKARKNAPKPAPRGVDRVPAHLLGLSVTVEQHQRSAARLNQDGSVRRGGTVITTEVRDHGNHDQRRARGQRGKARPPRRRELRDAYADNRLPDSPLAQQRAATLRKRRADRATRTWDELADRVSRLMDEALPDRAARVMGADRRDVEPVTYRGRGA